MYILLQREIRGIPCDVWVAESLSNEEGQYSTIELYFSRPDYHILVEEVNSLSQLPLGMRTYFAPSVSTYQSHYIEVVQGDIFMEQKMRFGLVLGRLAILKKKIVLIMSNF